MNIYLGTYTGEVLLYSGSPLQLSLSRRNQVSQNSIRCMFLPKGSKQLLIGGYDEQLKALDRANILQRKECKQAKGIINCIQTISETVVAVGLDNGLVRFWDWKNWNLKKQIKQHKKSVNSFQMEEKGVLFASVANKSMIFWNPLNYQSIFHYKFDYDIQNVLFDNNFQHIFLLNSQQFHHLKAEDNSQIHVHKFKPSELIQTAIVFQKYLIIGTDKGNILIWTIGNYQHKIFFKAHSLRVKILKPFVYGEVQYLFTASSSGEIRIWDVLQFLKQVQQLSQDYQLQGLQPLFSIQTGRRIICAQIYVHEEQQQQDKSQVIQQKKMEIKQKKGQNKQKIKGENSKIRQEQEKKIKNNILLKKKNKKIKKLNKLKKNKH